MLDLHTHLLPGIDDGPKTLDDALKLARAMVRDGVQHVVATPHIYPGVYDNTLETIGAAYHTMVQALDQAQLPLVLSMGAEVRLCAEMLDWLREGRLPFLGGMGPEHRTVLVELPDAQIPVGTERVLGLLVDRGVRPLIAHPERNRAVAEDVQRLQPFLEMGCKLQVTAASLLGEFGNRAEKAAQELLDLGWVEVIASDAHNLGGRRPRLGAAREWLIARLGQEVAEALTEHNPARLAGMGELMQLGRDGMLLRDLPPLQASEAAMEAKAAAQPSAAGRSLLDALTDLPAPSDAGFPAATVTGTGGASGAATAGAAGATQPGRLGEGAWAAPPHWPKAAAQTAQPKPDRTEDAGAHWRLSDFGDTAPLTTVEADEGLAPLEEWTLPLGPATPAQPEPATASAQAAAPKAEPQTAPKTAPKTAPAGTPPQAATRRTEETELAQQARRDRLATLARELREALPTEPLPLDQEAKAAQAAAPKPAAARAAEAAEAPEPATAAAPQAPAPAEPPTPQVAPAADGTAASPQESSAKGDPGKGRSWSLLRWWQRKPTTRVEPQMQSEPEPEAQAQVQSRAPATAPAMAPTVASAVASTAAPTVVRAAVPAAPAAPMAKVAPLTPVTPATPVMPTAPATASRPSADPVAPVAGSAAGRFASAPGMRPRGEPPELTDTVPAALVTPLLDASGDSPLRPAPLRRMPAPVGEITDVQARPLPKPVPATAPAPIAAPAPETTPAPASVTAPDTAPAMAPVKATAQATLTPRPPAPADLPAPAKAQDRIAPAAAMPPPKAAAASPAFAPAVPPTVAPTVPPTVEAATASLQAPAAARPNGSTGTNGLNGPGTAQPAGGFGQPVSLRSLPDVEAPAHPASRPTRRDEPAEARSRAFIPGRGSRASSGLARGDLASSFMPTVPDDFDDRPSWQAEAAIAAATEMAVGAQPRLTPPLHKSASGSGRPVGFRLSEITPVGYEPEPQRNSAMSAAQTRSR